MIDCPIAHLATVLTPLSYLQWRLSACNTLILRWTSKLMVKLVKFRGTTLSWKNLMLCIVMMHTLIRFPGCTVTPTKSLVLRYCYVQHSSDSIVCGKAWTIAICAYHPIITVLLHNFYLAVVRHTRNCAIIWVVRYFATASFWAQCFVAQVVLGLVFLQARDFLQVTWLPEC